MYLWISIALLLVGAFFLYEGIGNIVRIILLATVVTTTQVIATIKQRDVNNVNINFNSSVIWTVLGMLSSGLGLVFLTAYLVIA